MLGYPIGCHRLPKGGQELFGSNLSLNANGNTLAGKLIKHGQQLERATFVRPVKNEIPSPNVIAVDRLRRQARRDALSRDALGLRADFQPLFPPDALDLLATDRPTFPRQYGTDPALAIARILPG